MHLTPGLPTSVYHRWSVCIAPEVGEPYLSGWKAHLGEQVRRTSVTVAAGLTGPPVRAKREVKPKAAPKRPREDVPPPPSNSREERVKRLRAAQAAPAVQVAGRRLPLPPPRPTGSPSRGSGPPAASSGPCHSPLGPSLCREKQEREHLTSGPLLLGREQVWRVPSRSLGRASPRPPLRRPNPGSPGARACRPQGWPVAPPARKGLKQSPDASS